MASHRAGAIALGDCHLSNGVTITAEHAVVFAAVDRSEVLHVNLGGRTVMTLAESDSSPAGRTLVHHGEGIEATPMRPGVRQVSRIMHLGQVARNTLRISAEDPIQGRSLMNNLMPSFSAADVSRLGTLVAAVRKEIALVPDAPATTEGPPRHSPLEATWSRLVGMLDLGPEPEMRVCPECKHPYTLAATRCGHRWASLPPLSRPIPSPDAGGREG